MDSYDAVPYESTPLTDTHPGHLAIIGRLFGLETADPDRCRVLELGCASGGNLVPLAWNLPESTFLGLELSARQAAEGAESVRVLGLGNIEIRQGDILDFDAGTDRFDYIIAHGVYSWVPEPVRERLLALCGELLAPNGVAYISYNTLPGWRMKGMLRDMLLHHMRGVDDPALRLQGAHDLLAFLDTATAGLEALSARFLREEIAHLRTAHPSYLYHEYLETFNEPQLFSTFIARAAQHGLQYLADAELHTLFPTTLGERAAELLEGFAELEEQEQYMDFIRSRSFRKSLLCRADAPLIRELGLEQLDGFAFHADLAPPRKLDLRRAKEQSFTTPGGERFDASHPLTKAALAHLGAVHPDSVALPALLSAARTLVARDGDVRHAAQAEHLAGELFSLLAHGAVRAEPRARRFPRTVPARPAATALARLQAAGGAHLATVRHATVGLDGFARRLVHHLDGTRDRDALVEALLADIHAGALPNPDAGAPRPERLRERVAANCDRLLALFARQGVLAG